MTTSVAHARRPAVVLSHGLLHPLGAVADRATGQGYFRDVPAFLREKGYRVLAPCVQGMGHIKDRAYELGESISQWSERSSDERVIVLSHSMGGLDSRYLVSKLRGNTLVESIVSIGTPHRGCSVADFVVNEVPKFPLVSRALKDNAGLSLDALDCLTRNYSEQFNAAVPNAQDVRYFSVSGLKGEDLDDYSPLLRPSHVYVKAREGPNDGMVSVQSSIWGKHLGVLPYDHLEQITEKSMYLTILDAVTADQKGRDLSYYYPSMPNLNLEKDF